MEVEVTLQRLVLCCDVLVGLHEVSAHSGTVKEELQATLQFSVAVLELCLNACGEAS